MRLLFVGDAAATGFGTVTADLGRGLLDRGVDVRFLSMNVHNTKPPEPFGSRTYDVEPGERPEAVLAILNGTASADWSPDAILMVADYYSSNWVTYVPEVMESLSRVPSFHYCPIEGVGIPPAWRDLWDIVKPISMTRFGQAEIARVMGYEPPMIYHGVDQETFYPIAPNRPSAFPSRDGGRPTNKASAKVHFGLDPNRKMLLRTDRFMPRKQYPSMLRALYPVLEKHPDADLVIHCRTWDQGGNLHHLMTHFPDWYKARVYFTFRHDTYVGMAREELNLLYNAADVYVSSGAEGFGLTIAEAIACGVPAVGIDYSAVPEVIGPAGVLVPVAHLIDNEYSHFWAVVDEAAYARTVDRLLSKPSLRRQLGAEGPKHVAANFSWARAAEQMHKVIGDALVEAAA